MASPLRLLLVLLIFASTAFSVSQSDESFGDDGDEYVRSACSVTMYRDICIRSLEAYSNVAKYDTRKWAQAAVAVTLAEAKNTTHYLNKLKKQEKGTRKKRHRIDLSECIDCFEETVENIQNSLRELRILNRETFDAQIGNVETWMSSALTYEDTCIDGIENGEGKQVRLLHNKILKLSYITSNALALVSKLASAGDEINA